MKLFNVIWKILSSGSKLDSLFILKLDELLTKLSDVADKGGSLILKVSLTDNGILVEDEIQLPKTIAEKKVAEKKPAPVKAKPSKLEQVKADAERMAETTAKAQGKTK
jgi:hypothetical protein